ncbi:hypothetical protein CERSUDRAFT_101549 [Gelatoporia subvermispora B]|uniref:Uncharacterized protein n=1 Tax=Ceriporiopsis subvermispora (strain B) TaxID=914234 RepID=M2P536_CERS8|nr:hypothetical protein CERSUDRAFT_101549 [Gelatoporia subvermispora B]
MLWPATTFLRRRACIGTANGRERSLAGRRNVYISKFGTVDLKADVGLLIERIVALLTYNSQLYDIA